MRWRHRSWKTITTITQKVNKVARYKYMRLDNARLAESSTPKGIKRKCRLSINDRLEYRKYWGQLDRFCNMCHVKNSTLLTGCFDKRIVPSDVYFGIIEPILNNRKYGLGYEDKCRIDWLNGTDNVPEIYLRNIHGVYYKNDGSVIEREDIDFDTLLQGIDNVVVKKSIEEHGGKGVEIFEREGGVLLNRNNEKLSLDYMESKHVMDFLMQERLEQHDYYKAFNPSSLNTFRVVTYRSVRDNKIHILYSYLRVGAPNMQIDNVSCGGVFICLNQEGIFAGHGMTEDSEFRTQAGTQPAFAELGKAYKIEEIWDFAKQVASHHFNCRLLGLDLTVDVDGKVKLIEVNTSDIGMEGQQYMLGPLFHKYTDEVIEYCKKRLVNCSKYHIYYS
ncbi:sugar-transfer associated ATP-grasp domain-containing protein [Carboxylicivirga sp. RSCT41]|uniref:sugar-transfer associated ATP-grasp domain-containing protein n=1 Tax=Carboxylicivirga agarovorans TaxID=3417570 RepID=UPI003D3400D8